MIYLHWIHSFIPYRISPTICHLVGPSCASSVLVLSSSASIEFRMILEGRIPSDSSNNDNVGDGARFSSLATKQQTDSPHAACYLFCRRVDEKKLVLPTPWSFVRQHMLISLLSPANVDSFLLQFMLKLILFCKICLCASYSVVIWEAL